MTYLCDTCCRINVTKNSSTRFEKILRLVCRGDLNRFKIDFQNDNEHCQEEFAWPFCWPKTRIGTRIRIPCGTTTGNQSETQLERYCGSNGVWQEELLATNSNETE